jgi:hypothetical protein
LKKISVLQKQKNIFDAYQIACKTNKDTSIFILRDGNLAKETKKETFREDEQIIKIDIRGATEELSEFVDGHYNLITGFGVDGGVVDDDYGCDVMLDPFDFIGFVINDDDGGVVDLQMLDYKEYNTLINKKVTSLLSPLEEAFLLQYNKVSFMEYFTRENTNPKELKQHKKMFSDRVKYLKENGLD